MISPAAKAKITARPVLKFILGFLFIAPVLAAQHFNLDGSTPTLASALISVCLWLVLAGMIAAGIQHQTRRTATSLALYTLLALYYSSQLASYYLQGSYFNRQYFFHMNITTLTESWRAYFPQLLLFAVWMTSIWTAAWWCSKGRVRKGSAVLLQLLVLVLAIAFDPGLRTSSVMAAQSILNFEENGLVSVDWGQLQLNKNALQDTNLETIDWKNLHLNREALDPSTEPVTAGKNLVLIFLEGFDRLYTDNSVFPNLTPNLSALNTEGWQLDNFRQALGTGWTMGGLISSLCGTPLLHQWQFGGNNIMFTKFLNKANCLPDILHKAGYAQTFMGGASLKFAGKGNFLSQHSFDNVYGRTALKQQLSDPTNLGGWGLFDDSLFDLAAKEFKRLASTNKPFNLTLLTVDTHHPSGEPSGICRKYEAIDNSILHAVHCTDYLVGRFISQLQQSAAYSDTVVVILSDHLAMRNNAFPLFPKGYGRKLYFNALNSGLTESSGTLATPMDVAPTVLNLLGVQHTANFLAGVDITSINGGHRDLKFKDPLRNKTLAFLNSNFLTADIDKKRPFVAFKSDDLDFEGDIDKVSVSPDEVTFTVTGKSPYFRLPKIKNVTGDTMYLTINLDAPDITTIRVFFKTRDNPRYSHENSRVVRIETGNNKLTLPLPANADHGRLRIRPGTSEGEYTVHSIEIHL